MKKHLLIIGLVFFVSNILKAEVINFGDTKEAVIKILGEPDLITTREELKTMIYPRPLDQKRYRYKFEFWIYYKGLRDRKNWGYIEFDKEGKVVDYFLHPSVEEPIYQAKIKVPEIEIFNAIGKFDGEDWNLMPDKSKLLLVVDIIDRLRIKGIVIKKSPLYYLEELDSFYQDPGHLKFTVINSLYCFAVLNRDWDDGSDRDERIRKLLPSDMWPEFLN